MHEHPITKSLLESFSYCGKDHLSHRLAKIGLGQKRAVLVLYVLALAIGIDAVVLRNLTSVNAVLLFFQAMIIISMIILLISITTKEM